jgi:hypothetical protein
MSLSLEEAAYAIIACSNSRLIKKTDCQTLHDVKIGTHFICIRFPAAFFTAKPLIRGLAGPALRKYNLEPSL